MHPPFSLTHAPNTILPRTRTRTCVVAGTCSEARLQEAGMCVGVGVCGAGRSSCHEHLRALASPAARAGLLGLVCCPPTHWHPRPEPCLIRPWTQRAPKACPGSFSVVDGDWAAVVPCSGHGSCAGRPGRPVCREGDTCDVACVCDAGYGGAGCGSTTNQTAAARQVSSLTKAQPLAAVLVD